MNGELTAEFMTPSLIDWPNAPKLIPARLSEILAMKYVGLLNTSEPIRVSSILSPGYTVICSECQKTFNF